MPAPASCGHAYVPASSLLSLTHPWAQCFSLHCRTTATRVVELVCACVTVCQLHVADVHVVAERACASSTSTCAWLVLQTSCAARTFHLGLVPAALRSLVQGVRPWRGRASKVVSLAAGTQCWSSCTGRDASRLHIYETCLCVHHESWCVGVSWCSGVLIRGARSFPWQLWFPWCWLPLKSAGV